MDFVFTEKELLMRQSTSSQEGGPVTPGLPNPTPLPYSCRSSIESGQPPSIIERVDHLGSQIQHGSSESLHSKQNDHMTDNFKDLKKSSSRATEKSQGKSLEDLTIMAMGNGGSTISRSDSFTENLSQAVPINTHQRVTRQRSGSCDNLEDSHSKLSSQTSSESRPRSGSFAGSLDGTKDADEHSGALPSSWTSNLIRARMRDSMDSGSDATGIRPHVASRMKSRESHDSHSDATTLSRRGSIEEMNLPHHPQK